MTFAELLAQAEAALLLAVEDAEYARGEWVKAGRPLEQRTQNGMRAVDPLRKALVEADDRVARRRGDVAAVLGRGQVGRPVGASSAPDRVPPPRVKLRAVSSGDRGS